MRTITRPFSTVRSSPSQQHEAEVAGDVGVLEVGVVERARASGSPTRASGSSEQALQRVAEGAEEAGEAVDVRLGVEVGEDARGGDPVLQREAGAGGGLGAVAEHPPGAVGAAADLEGEEVQVVAAARRDADQRPQPLAAAGDQARGQVALGDEAVRAVEVGDDAPRAGRRAGSARGRCGRPPPPRSGRGCGRAARRARSGRSAPYWRKKTPASRRYWSPRAKRRASSSGARRARWSTKRAPDRPDAALRVEELVGDAGAAGGSRRAGVATGSLAARAAPPSSDPRRPAQVEGHRELAGRGSPAAACRRRRCGRAARSGRGGGPRPRCR